MTILGRVAAGTDRGAFLHGHADDECNAHVAAGASELISVGDLSSVYVEATDGTPVAAVALVRFI